MKQVSISYAQRNLSALIREVERGTHIVLTWRGKPVADLIPHKPSRPVSTP